MNNNITTWHEGIRYEYVECVSDFAGNFQGPGFWADIWAAGNFGKRLITLGGNWEYYVLNPPKVITDAMPEFEPFLAACAADMDLNYARTNWGKRA